MKYGPWFLISSGEEIIDITDLLSSQQLISYINYNLRAFISTINIFSAFLPKLRMVFTLLFIDSWLTASCNSHFGHNSGQE